MTIRLEDSVGPRHALTMSDVLIWHTTHRPDQPAFVFLERGEREAGTLTYRQLDARARAIAVVLDNLGLRGQPVVLAYPTCLEAVAAFFGCFYAGAIAVPAPVASRGYAADRLRAILADAGAAAVLSLRSVLDQERERGENATLANPTMPSIATDELIAVDCPAPPAPAGPGDLALLQYTSGSTGNARGVMVTHANLISNQHVLAVVLGLRAGEVVVNWLPLYHDMGLIGGVLYSVYMGLTCYLMPPLTFLQRPIRWLQAISNYRAAISPAPAFAFRLCSEHRQSGRDSSMDLSSWRVAICGGEPVRPEWLEAFAAKYKPAGFDPRAYLPAYGLAESTLMATAEPAGRGLITHGADATAPPDATVGGWTRRLACCGRPAAGHELAIVNPATGSRVADGQTGEIWLRGPSIAKGYWNRPEETRTTFQARLADGLDGDGWLRAGDLGFMGADGLVISGRAKETIVIRGVNYDPLDLETAACESHSALISGGGGAFSVELEDRDAIVLVNEISRTGSREVDVTVLANTVIETISRCFGLTLYDFVLLLPGTLPRTTSGKIQRHLCRSLYLAGELKTVHAIAVPSLGRSRPRDKSAS
jgi:acyl-CoA synthetase (AMP-forming)/AMP-acid ligase II